MNSNNNQIASMQNPDELNLLPSLHGQTMQRFEGIMEHKDLERAYGRQESIVVSPYAV